MYRDAFFFFLSFFSFFCFLCLLQSIHRNATEVRFYLYFTQIDLQIRSYKRERFSRPRSFSCTKWLRFPSMCLYYCQQKMTYVNLFFFSPFLLLLFSSSHSPSCFVIHGMLYRTNKSIYLIVSLQLIVLRFYVFFLSISSSF